MVRLKDYFKREGLVMCKISIPYGAIKSWFYMYKRMLEQCISIPYGAIKSTSHL